jgi:Tol biopolymer transport system component/tRNA A-37 threonylcarbamoyl transferase component Bud32
MADLFHRLQSALAGRYVLVRELGAGGMATVYLAEDVRHHRKVAVKVLRSELAATLGPDRFAREVEIAAQLQHPHILPVLDSGDADGLLYYVMPFVDGESLRARLARQGELPVPEAIRLLREIADALAYAHARGVVHRDVKPDNVLLSGRHVLVADFGVAKAVSEAGAAPQTLTTAGVAIGTPAYMAPEQAAADPHVDHRADIYALGVLGYELLTGGPPFSGTAQAVLAAQVSQEPAPVTQRRPAVPAPLVELIARCLAKRPADRWQSAQEIVDRLEAMATPGTGTTPTATQLLPAPRARSRIALAAGVVGAAAALSVVALLALRKSQPARLELGRATQVTFDPGLELDPALSPDGKFVAYAKGPPDRMRLFVRQVSGGQPIAVTPDSGPPQRQPQWAPDGSRLLYQAGDSVYLVPALGGVPRLVGAGLNTRGGSGLRYFTTKAWAPDGDRLVFNRADTLFVQPLDGSSPRVLARLEVADPHSFTWSPDGRLIAFVVGNGLFTLGMSNLGNIGPSAIWVIPASGGASRKITEPVALHTSPAWAADSRHLLFVSNRDGPRDVYRVLLGRDGTPVAPVERVTQGLNAHSISVNTDGSRLAYSALAMRANIWVVNLPSNGRPADPAAMRSLTEGSQIVEAVALSADGRWIYFDSNLHGNQDLYRMPAGGGAIEQLTTNPADDFHPDPSPDGREITFHAVRNGTRDILMMPAGGGAETTVYAGPYEERWPHWSPDGKAIAFAVTEGAPGGMYVIRRASDGSWGTPRRLSPREAQGHWTPDGRALLVEQGFADWDNVYVVHHIERIWVETGRTDSIPLPIDDAIYVGIRGGRDGRELFLRTIDLGGQLSFWAMPLAGGPPRLLLRVPGVEGGGRGYWATDGKRLYFTRTDRESDIFVAEVNR